MYINFQTGELMSRVSKMWKDLSDAEKQFYADEIDHVDENVDTKIIDNPVAVEKGSLAGYISPNSKKSSLGEITGLCPCLFLKTPILLVVVLQNNKRPKSL